MSYYHLRLHEQNEEQEYTHDCLVCAENYEEALKLSRAEAQAYYGNDEDEDPEGIPLEDEEDTYEFFPGMCCIAVSVESLRETTKQEFIDYLLSVKTIGTEEEEVCHG